MISIFLMYLWDTDLILLNFFQILFIPPWLVMSYNLFEVSLYSFSYDSLYTHFVQYIEYKNGEQSCMLIPTIQNLV
jgi:hypothetical protein